MLLQRKYTASEREAIGRAQLELRTIFLYRDHRVGGFLCAGQTVHRPPENGHCVASLAYGHCLHINIELQPRALLVDEVTTFAEIVEKIDDLVCA